jgi:hypothetical protein
VPNQCDGVAQVAQDVRAVIAEFDLPWSIQRLGARA